MWKIITPVAAAMVLGLGCSAGGKGEPRAASSLVYSPADRMAAEREAQAARHSGVDALRTGVRCRVHLRRDAVGMAGQAPLPIVGTSMPSERASVVGTLARVEPDALVIRGDDSDYWIPREVILAVQFLDRRRP